MAKKKQAKSKSKTIGKKDIKLLDPSRIRTVELKYYPGYQINIKRMEPREYYKLIQDTEPESLVAELAAKSLVDDDGNPLFESGEEFMLLDDVELLSALIIAVNEEYGRRVADETKKSETRQS